MVVIAEFLLSARLHSGSGINSKSRGWNREGRKDRAFERVCVLNIIAVVYKSCTKTQLRKRGRRDLEGETKAKI